MKEPTPILTHCGDGGHRTAPKVGPPLVLRAMIPGDLDALWSTFQEIIEEGTTYVEDEKTTRGDFSGYWTGRGGEQWVAEDGGRVVGGYTLRPNHVGRGSHVATASYVVAERARGLGVGTALGEHSVGRARALGFSAIQFNFVVSTNTAAVKLWQRLGFSILATLPEAYRHRSLGRVDALIMYKRLS